MRKASLLWATGLLLMVSCAHTRISESWRNPDYQGAPPRKVLVVARLPNEGLRYELEKQLASRLGTLGIEAVPSSNLFPDSGAMSPQQAWDAAQSQGFDGIVTCRFLGIERVETYVPESMGYWDWAWGPWGGPGRIVTNRIMRMETNLFDVRHQGVLVWSA